MLLLFGGYRPQNQAVFPLANGEPKIAKVAKAVVADDQFVLTPDGIDTMSQGDIELSYQDVADMVQILERWMEGPGREEVFFGTLSSCFPLHVASEVAFLKSEWGSPRIIMRSVVIGYEPEGQPKIYDKGPPKQYQPLHRALRLHVNFCCCI
eukprot:COSAG01_NODE_11529_length_1913_cov_1.461411_1_plen_152_part_00